MWPHKIEAAYQRWIGSKELFHPHDFPRFAEFLWACIDNPNGRPDEVQFRERLARDRKLQPDAQGFPHPQVEKAQLLFTYFPEILKLKPYGPNDSGGR